jgi:hypothetical protein
MVFDGGGNQLVGLRFNEVTIPQGATILNAYIQFKVDEVNSGGTSLTVQGENTDSAGTFTTSSGDISSRDKTTAGVPWSPVPWLTVGEAGLDQRTPDITSVVQEIVNRLGWVSGNSLAIIISGTGERTAVSYNGDANGAPLFHVEYGPGGNQAPTVTITAPADGSSFPEGSPISFTGTGDDVEDGDISANLSWTSSVDGAIGTGASFSTSTLSLGPHTITASVADTGGLGGSDSITVTINVNQAPTVTITAPPDASSFPEGSPVNFTGTANDDEGDLSANLSWTSNVDGAIGTGASFSTSTLSVGPHTITASVTDTGGLGGSDSITVTIDPASFVEVRVAAASDDAEERASGPTNIRSTDLEMVFDAGGNQLVGMRFNGVTIPQGATILNAYIQFSMG